MKVVIDCYHVSEKMRGMGIYLSEILGALAQLPKIDFHLLTNNSMSAGMLHERFFDLKNVEIKTLKSPLPVYEQLLLPIYCHKIKADFLISSGNTATMFGVSKKQILLIHDVYYLKKKKDSDGANSLKRILGEIYRKSTTSIAANKSIGIISVSEFAKSDIVDELQVAADKVTIIYNGVDAGYSLAYELLSAKKKRILMVSGSSPQKNLPSTITGLTSNSLLKQEFEGIDIVGVSSEDELGLQSDDFVTYHGHLSRADVKRFYQSCSHFMLPSLYESFGIPAIEALMAGCDVYLSNRGAMIGLLEGVGSYYDPLEKAGLSDIVVQMALSKPLTLEQYQKNLAVAHKYTWENSILSFRDYLDAL
jgi:glycosyltransferase involved in cell wall biosynthesis